MIRATTSSSVSPPPPPPPLPEAVTVIVPADDELAVTLVEKLIVSATPTNAPLFCTTIPVETPTPFILMSVVLFMSP